MSNRLAHETSPYLLQHAGNPVDWYPWGPEALERARAEDRPILLSIGYAACHWCHVMAHESFENDAIAAVMNERFVCIKVDREERPDLDAVYMLAVQSLIGRGGWPLTMFLMPDGRPFYGGTYFPPSDRHGMPGFLRVIHSVHDAFQNRRDDVLRNATLLTEALTRAAAATAGEGELDVSLLDTTFVDLREAFDGTNGGFGGAPKFPQPMALDALLRYHSRTGDADALAMVTRSLDAMAAGGINDQLGGGFHRYSTDSAWLVPHFEKMLYDNALLGSLYTRAFQATADPSYARVAEATFDYLLREMRDPAGGFYSSQDADSDGVEGKFYVWTAAETLTLLGNEAAAFNTRYDVTDAGNWEGNSILRAVGSVDAGTADLADAKARLLAERSLRVAPATDDKVLTSWNALTIRALAEASTVLERPDYFDAAQAAAIFFLETMHAGGEPGGRLLRVWRRGHAHQPGYLEDYACLVNALFAVHEASFNHRWLHAARALADEMLTLFWDDEAGLMHDVGVDQEVLIVRMRDVFDNAVPSGGSSAAEALVRLGRLTGDSAYLATAERVLASVVPLLPHAPLGFGNWLGVLDLFLAPPREVAIIGDPAAAATQMLLRAARAQHLPNLIFIGADPAEAQSFASPLLEGRGTLNGKPAAYACEGYMCDLPTSDPEALARLLVRHVAS